MAAASTPGQRFRVSSPIARLVRFEAMAADAVPASSTEAIAMAPQGGSDPVDWIYQSWAYDAHNVGTTPGHGGDTAAALRAIRAPTLLLVPALDLYNPVDDAVEAAGLIPNATLVRLDGCAGHAVAADSVATTGRRPRRYQRIPDQSCGLNYAEMRSRPGGWQFLTALEGGVTLDPTLGSRLTMKNKNIGGNPCQNC